MLKLKLALIFSVALTCTAYAENWPNWRGPASTGVSQEKGLPVTWSSSENVAWKASIRGFGISSPIVWGNRVFVTSQVGTNLSRPGPRLFQQGDAAAAGERPLGTAPSAAASGTTFLITAFDTANGRKVWEHELQAEGELPSVHEKHNAATPSPATDGQRVYAVFGTGQIAAVGMDGKLAWKRNLATEYGKFDIMWGTGTSPIVYKDTVILLNYHPASAYLLAMDGRTGTNRWKVDGKKGAFSYSTPFII
jgi:outer membrane protein assembly factor BamB